MTFKEIKYDSLKSRDQSWLFDLFSDFKIEFKKCKNVSQFYMLDLLPLSMTVEIIVF